MIDTYPMRTTRLGFTSSRVPHSLVTLRGGSHVDLTDYCIPDWLATLFSPVDDRALIASMRRYGPGTDCSPPPRTVDRPMSCRDEHARVRQAVLDSARAMLSR